MKPTLIIADDHEILRDALASHASLRAGFHVVTCVADAQHAVNACRTFAPDVLLLDLEMPGRDPLAALADIQSASPHTRVVILTAYCRDAFIEIAVRSQVAGYLLKSDSPTAIFAALDRVLQGATVYSKQVAARLTDPREPKPRSPQSSTRLGSLSPREFEVLRNIARGLDNQQMAEAMSLSKRTIERHVARLMDAIAIRDRAAIMKFAYEQGLGV